jgi:alanine racemase
VNFDRVAAIIDFSSIKENYSLLCKTVHSQCKIMAVVKANAYGHGLLEVSRYLECIGVNYFAVASLSEEIELREGGINSNILILGHTNILKIKYIGEYNLIQTVATLQYAKDLNLSNIPINIHLRLIRMSRYGFYCHDSYDVEKVFDEIKTVSSLSNLSIQGIFTHFADADNKDSGFTERQFALFIELTNKCLDEGIYIGLRHCSNSAAIIKFSKMNLIWFAPELPYMAFHRLKQRCHLDRQWS